MSQLIHISCRLYLSIFANVIGRIFSCMTHSVKNFVLLSVSSQKFIHAITHLLIHLNSAFTCHDSRMGGLKNIFFHILL